MTGRFLVELMPSIGFIGGMRQRLGSREPRRGISRKKQRLTPRCSSISSTQ